MWCALRRRYFLIRDRRRYMLLVVLGEDAQVHTCGALFLFTTAFLRAPLKTLPSVVSRRSLSKQAASSMNDDIINQAGQSSTAATATTTTKIDGDDSALDLDGRMSRMQLKNDGESQQSDLDEEQHHQLEQIVEPDDDAQSDVGDAEAGDDEENDTTDVDDDDETDSETESAGQPTTNTAASAGAEKININKNAPTAAAAVAAHGEPALQQPHLHQPIVANHYHDHLLDNEPLIAGIGFAGPFACDVAAGLYDYCQHDDDEWPPACDYLERMMRRLGQRVHSGTAIDPRLAPHIVPLPESGLPTVEHVAIGHHRIRTLCGIAEQAHRAPDGVEPLHFFEFQDEVLMQLRRLGRDCFGRAYEPVMHRVRKLRFIWSQYGVEYYRTTGAQEPAQERWQLQWQNPQQQWHWQQQQLEMQAMIQHQQLQHQLQQQQQQPQYQADGGVSQPQSLVYNGNVYRTVRVRPFLDWPNRQIYGRYLYPVEMLADQCMEGSVTAA